MQPPHRIVVRSRARMLVSGKLNAAIAKTLTNAAIALALALVVGRRDRAPCCTAIARVRETLDPLFATYYAMPVFAFYPLLIIMFGLGDAPQIVHRLHARRRRGDRQHAQRPRPRAARAAARPRGSSGWAGSRPR